MSVVNTIYVSPIAAKTFSQLLRGEMFMAIKKDDTHIYMKLHEPTSCVNLSTGYLCCVNPFAEVQPIKQVKIVNTLT